MSDLSLRMTASRPLTLDEIRARAPSVFAAAPKGGLTDRYAFIPTTQVITALQGHGWTPVFASQSRSRSQDGRDFMKHVLRFRRDAVAADLLKAGDSVPELVLTNSHNGSSSFNLMLGLFRLLCSNGLTVAESSFPTHRVKHVGYTDDKVIDASFRVLDDVPRLTDAVSRFRSVELSAGERQAFAESAAMVRWEPEALPFEPSKLLGVRRHDDKSSDLWTTLNTVQENIIRGGVRGFNRESMRRTRTRAVASVSEDIRLNKALWHLADAMAAAKSGSTPAVEVPATIVLAS